MRRDGYGNKLMPLQHDFDCIELCKEKCGFIGSFLGCLRLKWGPKAPQIHNVWSLEMGEMNLLEGVGLGLN